MPKRKKHHFLPRRGEASDDPGEDYLLCGIAALIGITWEAVTRIVVALWALVRFLCWEAWNNPRKQ